MLTSLFFGELSILHVFIQADNSLSVEFYVSLCTLGHNSLSNAYFASIFFLIVSVKEKTFVY